jgi:hypothetical protein
MAIRFLHTYKTQFFFFYICVYFLLLHLVDAVHFTKFVYLWLLRGQKFLRIHVPLSVKLSSNRLWRTVALHKLTLLLRIRTFRMFESRSGDSIPVVCAIYTSLFKYMTVYCLKIGHNHFLRRISHLLATNHRRVLSLVTDVTVKKT